MHAFRYVLSALAAAGIRFRFVHAANTAAIFTLPEARFTLVRAGLGVYGLHPSEAVRLPADFRPAMQWKTQIVQIRAAPPGSVIGFGEGVRTETPLTLAIVPVGYADGLRRGAGQWAHALVRGARAPLVGAAGMDLAALDVTHIPDAHVGDEVVLLGQQGDDRITARDAARWLGASVYEVVAGILPGAARGR
ncbi:MAG: alanine racemase [Anaerolineae bacterium]|nr:alanine racemase [Anaerolineae bacterium]